MMVKSAIRGDGHEGAAGWRTGCNQLYFGDKLALLRKYVPNDCVDLVYLDPPFKSNANYNVLFKEHTGTPSQGQMTAFEDSWHWSVEDEAAYQETTRQGADARSCGCSKDCAPFSPSET